MIKVDYSGLSEEKRKELKLAKKEHQQQKEYTAKIRNGDFSELPGYARLSEMGLAAESSVEKSADSFKNPDGSINAQSAAAEVYSIGKQQKAKTSTESQDGLKEDLERFAKEEKEKQIASAYEDAAKAYMLRQGGFADEAAPHAEKAGQHVGQAGQFKATLNSLKTEEYEAKQRDELAKMRSIRQSEDYEEYSRKGKALDSGEGAFQVAGELANPVEFVKRTGQSELTDSGTGVAVTYNKGAQPKYKYLTEEEVKDYNYFLGKGDKKAAQEYLKLLDRELNKRESAYVAQTMKETAQENPALGVAQNIASSAVLAPISFLPTVGQNIKNKVTGEYEPVDAYSPLSVGAVVDEATREGLTEGKPGWQQLLINTGLSVGQMAAKLPAGAASLPLIGLGAAGSASQSAAAKGATAEQALGIGLVNGAVEMATEKLPIDRFFGLKGQGSKAGIRQAAKEWVKQMGVEGSEELISEYADTVADIAIMGDKSDYVQYRNALLEQGVSAEEAERMAATQFFVKNPAASFTGGALSGAVMGPAATALGDIQTARTGKRLKNSGDLPALWQEGLQAPSDSNIYQSADSAIQKTAQGQKYGNLEAGRYYQQLQEAKIVNPGHFLDADSKAARQQAVSAKVADEVQLQSVEKLVTGKGLGLQYVYQPDSGVGGMIQGDTITINLAHPDYAMNTAVHEIGHSVRRGDAQKYQRFENSVLKLADSNPEFGRVAKSVVDTYLGEGSPVSRQFYGQDGKIQLEAIQEEVSLKLAEQLVFDPVKLTQAVQKDRTLATTLLDFVKGIKNQAAIKLTGSQKAQLEESERTLVNMLRGKAGMVDGNFSIHSDAGGRPFVVIDEDILEGVPDGEQLKYIRAELKKRYPNGFERDGWKIELTSKSAKEFTGSKSTFGLKRDSRTAFEDKMRAAANLDEIIAVAENIRQESPKHARKDKIQSFNRADVRIRVGKNDYSAEVVTGIYPDTREIFYDIVKVSPIQIEDASANGTVQENPARRGTDTSSIISISNSDGEVNGKQSLQLTSLTSEDGGSLQDYILKKYGTAAQTATPQLSDLPQGIPAADVFKAVPKKSDPVGIEYFTDPLGLKRKKFVPLPIIPKEAPTRNNDVTARAALASGKGQLPAFSIADSAGGKQGFGSRSVGAAESNPGSYSAMQNQYGTIPPGEKPVRVVDVPKSTDGKDKVSQYARTVMEAEATPDSMIPAHEKQVEMGNYSHEVVTDKTSLAKADQTVERKGFEGALDQWRDAQAYKSKVTKDDIALAQKLYTEAAAAGDTKLAMQLTAELCLEATRAGQEVQAFHLLKKMTPDGQLYYLQRVVNRMQGDLDQRMGKRAPTLEINEQLAGELLRAQTPAEAKAAAEKIQQDVANQVPPTWVDKWNAYRYFAMLFNPRTHVRNILGNAMFVPVRKFKNVIGAALEGLSIIPTDERTKAILKAKDRPLVDFAKSDFVEIEEAITGSGKMNPKSQILDKRRIFGPEFMERTRKFGFDLLEKEDAWFLQGAYADSLAQYAKANGYTPEFLKSGTKEANSALQRAREYAITEAQKATYRDASTLANRLNKISKMNWAASVIVEGVMPFKKTPINILKRGVEYSPIGLMKGLGELGYDLVKKKKTTAQVIDDISAGLSGTAIMLLGVWLSHMGVISGAGEEGKEGEFERLQGEQNYALKIGDFSYTIDWAAPAVIPLFAGVELQKSIKESKGEKYTFSRFVDSTTKITDPVFEMTCLQGINSAIRSAQSNKSNPVAAVATNAVANYVSQAVPSLGGAVARTIDGTRRSTYVQKDGPVPKVVAATEKKMAAKIPGVTFGLEPFVDRWGRTQKSGNIISRAAQNFISPGYASIKNQTPVDKEVERLYRSTSENTVLPSSAPTSCQQGNTTYQFTPKEYTTFQTTMGQTAYKALEELFEDRRYKNLSDQQKAQAVEKVYKYAGEKARKEFFTGRDLSYDDDTVQKADKMGGIVQYALVSTTISKVTGNKDSSGKTISGSAKENKIRALTSIGYTRAEAEAIYEKSR
ncbi:hypothetical protein H7271_02215 [Bittarella massiliensis]|uniref:LPD3 domain-containing protein n=1 Tax=Bittarella massiliensis (ex Durand et al. 2017) TaxID=1720313 RepID=UPI00163CB585|nr:hypothetical protein [Bittarella massiliensis (ex Durand et al. 2017)]MBC2870419.1 hypothetical protein [Bittarella massiliensis (ex Durand et al. 2017)]